MHNINVQFIKINKNSIISNYIILTWPFNVYLGIVYHYIINQVKLLWIFVLSRPQARTQEGVKGLFHPLEFQESY